MGVTLKLFCLVIFLVAVTCKSHDDPGIAQVEKVKRADNSKEALIAKITQKLDRLKDEFTEDELDLLDDTLTDGEECPKVVKELGKKYKSKGKGKSREKRARGCSVDCMSGSCSQSGWGCWCRCSWGWRAKCTCAIA